MKNALYSGVDGDVGSIIWSIIFGGQSWQCVSKTFKLYMCFDPRSLILVFEQIFNYKDAHWRMCYSKQRHVL